MYFRLNGGVGLIAYPLIVYEYESRSKNNIRIDTDFRTVFVAGKAYTVYPPTIHKLAGAISCLSGVQEADNLKDVLLSLGESEAYSKALSWLITDDENLSEELANGTYEENVNALDEAFSLIDSKVFLKAVSLAKNVSLLAAKPRL